MTVAELEEKATMAELIHWNAYFNIRGMRQEVASRKAASRG
jgi:hypothetical protein